MKRLLFSIIALLLACCMLWGCAPKNDVPDATEPPEPASTDAAQPTEAAGTDVPGTEAPEAVTAGMAYEGVSNYCRYVYGWGTGREGTENCSLMMGEETETEYLVLFRSYTATFVDFYVDKTSGSTRMVERIPSLNIEEEAGTFDLFDYLGENAPTPVPEEPTAEPERFVFRPKVCSVYLEEIFGETMCETWFNLVDAVMAGENTFACPDKHTYDWVMGQFPNKCFPVFVELIDFAYDRNDPVKDGVGSFTWLVSPEEAAARIAEFAEQIEGILNEVLEPDWSDVEKALALYVYFSRTYEYDWDTYHVDMENQVDYTTTLRLFETGTGICREIAPAYSYLLMQAGVDAATVKGSLHEWSYVRINGRNYHIDPTYVLSEMDKLIYFMMTDDQRDATGCSKDNFIYVSNYAQDHPHPDYKADDDFFAPVWDYRFEKLFPDENRIRCWRYAEGDAQEHFEFDYSGFDQQ